MKIILFVRSYTISANRDALNIAYDFHYFWQGEAYHHIYRGFMDKIWSRGRVPDRDSLWLLNEIASLEIDTDTISVLDAGTMPGWFGSIWFGIWKLPGMIVDGEKAQDKDSCEALLMRME